MTTNGWLAPALLAALVGPFGAAQAMPIRADFGLNFYPPNPCNATDLGNLTGAALGGSFDLFYKIGRTGDLVRATPGAPALREVACGSSAMTGFDFDLDLDRGGATLYLSFAGALRIPSPGPPDAPVYAFAPSDEAPRDAPGSAPLIELGEISFRTPNPGPPDMPLYAFASPGHEIGSVSAQVRVVPEPGTVLLFAAGLLALAAARRGARGRAA